MCWKYWLARNLVVLIVAAAVTFVAAVLQALLQSGGDASAAAAVRGVAWVGATLSVVSAIGQIVLLSVVELMRKVDAADHPQDSPPPA